jgi:hypothetical protein
MRLSLLQSGGPTQLDDGEKPPALDVALGGSLFSIELRGPRRRVVETTQSLPTRSSFDLRLDRGANPTFSKL